MKTEAYLKQQERRKKMIAVFQFDKQGKYIGKHESIRSAERATGTKGSDIVRCLDGRSKIAGGFKWAKQSDYV